MGFECTVEEDDAFGWLERNRPDLCNALVKAGDVQADATCGDCGTEVESVIGCTDGAEVCQPCFDAGNH